MRNLACDYGRPQVSFGAVVGWLDTLLAEKTQQVAAIMLAAGSVEKALVVRITQAAVPEVGREFFLQLAGVLAVGFRVLLVPACPQQECLLQQVLEPLTKVCGASRFLLLECGSVADEMGQAFLLRKTLQFDGIITPSAVTDQNALKIGRDQFPHFLIPMP